MDLRLRNNDVAARFSMKPFGLRPFCRCSLSLLGRRSLRICSLVASRTKPKLLSAAVSRICGVEEWRGGVQAGHSRDRSFRLPVPEYPAMRSVSTPRSSNRTCGFPASGFRSRVFMLSPTNGSRLSPKDETSPTPCGDTWEHVVRLGRLDSGAYRLSTDAADVERGCPRLGRID